MEVYSKIPAGKAGVAGKFSRSEESSMRRVISLLLTVALLFGLVGTTGIQVFAQAEVQQEVTSMEPAATGVSGTDQVDFYLPAIYAGDPIVTDLPIEVSGGTVASELTWTDKWGDPLSERYFQENTYYAFTVIINAPEGAPYNLGHVDFTVNRDYYGTSYHYGENMESLEVKVEIYVEAANFTDFARLEGLPLMIQPGPAETPTNVTVADGDCYVTDLQWMTTDKLPVTAFEQGQEYYLAITLETETHKFGEYMDTYMWNLHTACQYDFDVLSESQCVVYYLYKTIYAPNGFTEYLGFSFPTYLPGDPIPELPAVEVEGGTISELEWYVEYGEDPVTETQFIEDKEYNFRLKVTAPEGYPFAPDAYDTDNIDGGWNSAGVEYADDLTYIEVYITIRPHFVVLGSAHIAGVPWEAEAGAAAAPDVAAESEHITLGQVYWTDMEENPVTTLEEGKTYYLAVELFPAGSYVFSEDDFTDIYTDGQGVDHYDRISRDRLIAYFFYSLEPDAGQVIVDMSGLAEGASIADYAPVVSDNATLKALSIYNLTTGQTVTDGVFEPNCNYVLEVVLEPLPGYRFDDPELRVLPYQPNSYGNGDYTLSFEYNFSTCQSIEEVEVSVVPPVPGGAASDAVATVDPDAPYTLESYRWWDSNADEVSGTFQAGEYYELVLNLSPKTGYTFDEEQTLIYVNGEYAGWRFDYNQIDIRVYASFTFGVQNVYLEGLPESIKAGTATTPTITDEYGQVTVTKTRWVNDAKTSKVTSFKNGKVYYLEVTVKPVEGKAFDTQQDPYEFLNGESPDAWKYNSSQELVLYYRYSLEPDAGTITITPSGLAVGTDISSITAAVTGNATLVNVFVRDYDEYEEVPEGTIAQGKNYYIQYTFAPKTGYRLTDDTKVVLNMDYIGDSYVGNRYITVEVYFSTCQKITEAQVTVTGVEVGKNIADVQVTVPEGVPYQAGVHWFDADGNTAYGKFQDLTKYEAYISLYPNEGYVFDSEVQLTFNGKADTQEIYGMGTQLSLWEWFSFLRPIETVSFPTLPASIKKGQTLPTDFAVSEDAPYTVYAQWGIMNEGVVTTAGKNASYLLHVQLNAKPGYEFTEDTKVFVDGKETQDYIPSGESDISLYRVYNVGVKEISRVDITVPAYTTGATPGKATVSSSAKYTLSRASWFYSEDGSINDVDDVTTFQKDTYVFLSPVLAAKSGYAFAEDVEVYVNGVKAESIRTVNLGLYLEADYLLGQVDDQPVKLSAPSVSVSGKTLTWEANGAAAYEIYRATSKSGKYTLLDTVTDGNAYCDETAVAGKTYYYKVKAISAAGSSYNSGFSAVSSVAYAFDAPTICVEMNYTTGKTVITWEKVSGAKSYDVYRAAELDGTYTKLGNTKATSYTDTKAAVGAVYYYKVVTVGSSKVYNSDGSNIYESYAILAQPVIKSAVDKATGKPVISWSKVTDAANYRVYRQLPGEEGFTLVSTQEERSFLDTTAPLDTLCTYYVVACGEVELFDSAYSNTVTATVALGVPSLKGNVNYYGQPSFHWQLIEGAVEYQVYRSTKSNKGFTLLDTVTDGNAYCDKTAVAGTTYYYKVVALGQVSKSEESAAVKLTATCAIPELTSETDAATGKPALSWSKIDGAKKGYEIYRSVNGGKFKKLKTVKTTTYVDTSAPVGSTCTYQVRALASKSAGNSDWSETTTRFVICSAVTVKISVDTVTGKPSLSWKKTTGAAGYRIYRQLPGEETFTVVGEVTATSFKDTTAPVDTECLYKVVTLGKTEELNSEFSKEVSATSGISRPAFKGSIDAATGQFCLTWDAVDGAVAYEIYRSTSSKKGFTLMDTVETLSYTEASAPGKTYYYKVIAVGQVSKSSDPTALKLVGKCAQTTVAAETDLTSGKPVITWEAVSGAKKYEVYRATSENGKYSKVGTVAKLTYTDTKAAPGKTYYYKVIAMASSSSSKSAMSEATQGVAAIPAQPVVTVKNDSKTGKLIVSWKKVSGATKYLVGYVDVTEYLISGEEPTEQELMELVQTTTTTKTSFTIPDAVPGHVYMLMVAASPKNEEYCSYPSELQYGVTTCATPKIKGTLEDGKPAADWKAVEGADIYAVYRSTKSNKDFEYIGYVEGPGFVDVSAVKGKTYYYKVTAVTFIGEVDFAESAFSNVIKVKSK